jgi:hypothetical protein
VPPIHDHVHIARLDERRQSGHRPLDQRLLTEKPQERLRAFRPAQRPKPGPSTAGENDRVHGRLVPGRIRHGDTALVRELGRLVGPLPREVVVGPAEMTVGRRRLVDGPAQIESLNDARRA